jgi:archaeosine-15-forming tRNA-guanine transglycosylase
MGRKIVYEQMPERIKFGSYEFIRGVVRDDLPDHIVDHLIKTGRVREVFDQPPPLQTSEKESPIEEPKKVIKRKEVK